MSPFANCLPLQAGRPFTLSSTVGRLAVFCLLLASLSKVCSAQNTKGLPEVGNGSAASSSQMFVDATAFSGAADMCASIATACSKLGSSTSYPLGATIDARGFTGNQVCAAGNITTMLFHCSPQGSSTGATGGKLLLGEVNLYADGPTAHPYYTDGLGSGIGTPALIIPSNFWGIEGISRGSSAGSGGAPGTGTFLSVCTGSGAPVTGCSTAFPQRSFQISGTTIVTSGGITTMTVAVSGTLTKGTNIYPGELGMVKTSSVTGDNGTFKLQSINRVTANTVEVTVPAGTLGGWPSLSRSLRRLGLFSWSREEERSDRFRVVPAF